MNDQKNLLYAIIISLVILLGFQTIFPPEEKKSTNQIQNQENIELPKLPDSIESFKERSETLNESDRIFISGNARVTGSIALTGGRFDDLILNDYSKSITEDLGNIVLFSPSKTINSYFAEFGWVTNGTLETPDKNTVWNQVKGNQLGPGNPVTIEWISKENVKFTRTIHLDENYMFSITQKIENNGNQSSIIYPYGRISRTGFPDTLNFYILHEGPIGVLEERLMEIDYDDLIDDGPKSISSQNGWIGITDKYWLTALIPEREKTTDFKFQSIQDSTTRFQTDYIGPPVELMPGSISEFTSHLFAGAKEVSLLDDYASKFNINMFDRAVDFGWFYVITKPLFYLLHWLSGRLGNVGLAILALTVGIRIAMFPLANKSFKAMSRMKQLTPKMTSIRERYSDNKQQMQQEVMKLYKEEKVNPLAGCLPILVQIPIFFALYKVLFVTLETRHQPFYGWIEDLSAPDPYSIFNLFGLIPIDLPNFLIIGGWPILMAVTMFLQQKLNPAPPDPLQAKVMMMLPLIFLFLFATFPSGLVIYWTWNNVLSIAQQWYIMKRVNS
tara:strand:- start:288 stop:1958 length:1671 start_codon:yes stop_codon:yes gene_type:complete